MQQNYTMGEDFMSSELPDFEITSYKSLSQTAMRSLVFHYLYAMEGFDYSVSLGTIIDMFNRGYGFDVPFDSKSASLTQKIIDSRHDLDKTIVSLLSSSWRLERIGLCTKLILRMTLFELQHSDIPSVVLINEAIELAKAFSEKDAYKFINGILDEFCKKHKKDDN